MKISTQVAKHFRDVFFGGNWTASSVQQILESVTWEQATTKVYDLNTICTLTFHIHYYVAAVLRVFQGETLQAKDAHSFDHPELNSQAEWDTFIATVLADATMFSTALEQLPEDCFDQPFTDEKYGSYYRNIHGIIEHTHYHLGQISLIKKILDSKT
ncbi:DinB family protein [Kordia jejudonensis]|uniref:DinB family protein n=1 Tax=Kordia jejudonensis TaxID=1348245 RepID=UPI000629CDE7|nr:DinB family protein [Kordia jejudonensis]